ncbi:MAG: serine hydrolase [Micropruina sp.]|uniref:serine hydrolase n=1 Tax=Micropruina sp. TaxID=2737536 RepID=UPI0039E632B7
MTQTPLNSLRFTRRTGLLALGAASLVPAVLTGCSNAPTVPTPTASPTGTVREQLQQVLEVIAQGQDKLGVAVLDLRSGASWDFRGDWTSQSASMAKPMIVSMALRKARADALQQPLPAEQAGQAEKAIRNSDNDSADALWKWAGGRPAYDALAADLGLKATHSAPEKDFWSWTWTTPDDQRSFLKQLVKGGTKALTDAERSYLLGLMGQVQDDQTWGVGAPRSSSVKVELKNGWVQFESTDKLWAVNSIGHVAGDGRDYLLTIMTRVATFDLGKAYCTAIGDWVFRVLGSGELR